MTTTYVRRGGSARETSGELPQKGCRTGISEGALHVEGSGISDRSSHFRKYLVTSIAWLPAFVSIINLDLSPEIRTCQYIRSSISVVQNLSSQPRNSFAGMVRIVSAL